MDFEDDGVRNEELPRPEWKENGEQSVEKAKESHCSVCFVCFGGGVEFICVPCGIDYKNVNAFELRVKRCTVDRK